MADKVTRVYSGFRGVDFRGEDINLVRSPDALNVWKDYTQIESIRTRPGLKLKQSLTDIVYGIFFYSVGTLEYTIIHSGNKLYRITDTETTEIYSECDTSRSEAFVYAGVWYFKDGKNYLRYDGTVIMPVEGYVPTTSISRSPAGGGSTYEDVNLLTSKRKNSFVGDGTSKDYYLDAEDLDEGSDVKITVNGEGISDFTVNYEEGKIIFNVAPARPLTDGQDNVVITFSKTVAGYRDRIEKCTLLTLFDNRVFYSGNPDFPNVVWHCSLDDPEYCSDLDYYNEGLDESAVRGMVPGNNALWVFREPSQANTTAFYHTPTTDNVYGKIYPNTHSSISLGCVGRAINFNDDIVIFSDRGMEGVSADITTEQFVSHRSTMVDRKLLSEESYKNMLLEEWKGYLLVCIANKIYLADSRGLFTNENHTEYEWFYWELEKEITSVKAHNDVLYIGTPDGVYTLTEDSDVVSYWVTPKDKFGYPNKLKTTNKRGCVVEAVGDLSVYAKTEDSNFETIGNFNDVSDYFTCRIKRKKFKDIQLKFYSDTRFSLESTTLEAYIGGYIKR